MITTGEIKKINVSIGDKYKNNAYEVEISIFKSAADTVNKPATVICTACQPGGVYNSYAVGDRIYLGFVNNNLASPVILGKIYTGDTSEARSYIYADSIKVLNKAELPTNTTLVTKGISSDDSSNKKYYNHFIRIKANVTATQKVSFNWTFICSEDKSLTKDQLINYIKQKTDISISGSYCYKSGSTNIINSSLFKMCWVNNQIYVYYINQANFEETSLFISVSSSSFEFTDSVYLIN